MSKRQSLYAFSLDGNVARFDFPGTPEAALVVDMTTLAADIVTQLTAHGFKQKVADAAAIERDPETGRPATPASKIARMRAVFERLVAGEWRATGEGGVGGGLLFRALCELYDGTKTPEAIREYLAAKSDKQKAALRLNPKVAPIIERLRAEAGSGSEIDSDALLDELGEE